MTSTTIGWFFLGLAAVFVAVTIRDYGRTDGVPSPSRRAWIRIAIIIALVGVMLQLTRLV